VSTNTDGLLLRYLVGSALLLIACLLRIAIMELMARNESNRPPRVSPGVDDFRTFLLRVQAAALRRVHE
jgi:hypothetical protein